MEPASSWLTVGAELRDIALREHWTYHSPVEPGALAAFEAAHGVVIPDPYRRFLSEVTGGIETDCMQLAPFSRAADEIEQPLAAPFPYPSAYGAALIAALRAGRTLAALAADPAFAASQVPGVPAGCLVIGELDGDRSVLVLTGEERGRVWQIGDFDRPETRHRHTGDGDDRPLDFPGWFSCWLIENGLRLESTPWAA